MDFDLDRRTATFGVGEFADFAFGPRPAVGGPTGLWRAQLGSRWHRELQAQAAADDPETTFEVPIEGRIAHRGWTFILGGRVDQLLKSAGRGGVLREIKTVTRTLPAAESDLRREYPSYFIQAATYAALRRLTGDSPAERTELHFVEADTGLAQTVSLTPADDLLFQTRLEEIVGFLDSRWRSRERRRHLPRVTAFAELRPGQETTCQELTEALQRAQAPVLFQAPTGFGKTGILLECGLDLLREGHLERLIYLTGKSTGQLHVVQTLASLLPPTEASGLEVWQVRSKSEHCVNATFHCVRESCRYLDGMEERWADSGLARFFRLEGQARDLETLRQAGRRARICPYEITRAALAFQDVWIGDFNYVFSPRHRGLFDNQPGLDPARTLLIVDEAHNLPSRVADALSHRCTVIAAAGVAEELRHQHVSARLRLAWEAWTHFLQNLPGNTVLDAAAEDDARYLIREAAAELSQVELDYATLSPATATELWEHAALAESLEDDELPRLWWNPQPGELALTCLDAAFVIGARLREFGAVVLASATLHTDPRFAAAIGLDREPGESKPTPLSLPETKRLGDLKRGQTRQLYKQLTSGASLLAVQESEAALQPVTVLAHTPWRDGAYDVACDVRADTTFQHRQRHFALTADTVAVLRAAAPGPVAVFFPSYRYAEGILQELDSGDSGLRVEMQPRKSDLAAQSAWVEQSLSTADALFLVLGSSFSEGIDALGGRISHAMVVGPALPEVNPVQHARMQEFASLGRDEAFRRVYQIPGMTKVNQALGRLVRAPGHRARVLLHCRRFAEPTYSELLAQEYRGGRLVRDENELGRWLADSD